MLIYGTSCFIVSCYCFTAPAGTFQGPDAMHERLGFGTNFHGATLPVDLGWIWINLRKKKCRNVCHQDASWMNIYIIYISLSLRIHYYSIYIYIYKYYIYYVMLYYIIIYYIILCYIMLYYVTLYYIIL